MIEVTPSGGPLGAMVTGVELGEPQSPETSAAIRAAWLEHLVLAFPDQPLTAEQFLSFARTLGTPMPYPFVSGIEGYPDIIAVEKLPDEDVNFGGIWHSDTTYLDRPPMASMLVAREIPPVGGDTEFANMYLAYETLPEATKQLIDPLRALNSSALADGIRTHVDVEYDDARVREAEHPVVRTHPETGRRSLFVNVAHTARFVGWTGEQSRPILADLFAHQVRDEFVWRLKWQQGMIAVWDNRCTLHNPINDYHGHHRLMHRITLEGDAPS